MVKEKYNRRKDKGMNKDDLIKEIMESNSPTRYLIARMYVEFRDHFITLNGKVSFHDKFIWTFIGILISGFIGGTIALLIQFFYK